MYIYFIVSFRLPFVAFIIIFCATQIHEHSLYRNPMLIPRCRHVYDQYSHHMRNIWSSVDHCIHQTTNINYIGNMFHILYLFLCLWTLFNNYLFSNKNWYLDTIPEVEMLQNCFNILPLVQPKYSNFPISLDLHSNNEVHCTGIPHLELGV
jgi:hypothetical protein